MTEDDQVKRLSYIARCLITDLRDLYAEECLGRQINEERALQLILDAFEQAASILTDPTAGQEQCAYCGEWYPAPVSYYHTDGECYSNLQAQHISTGPSYS